MDKTPFFDANLQVGRRATPRPQNDLTTEQILEEMALLGIARGLATHALAVEYDPRIGNERLSEVTGDHASLQACFVVQPHPTGKFPSGDALIEYLRNGRARAVRMYPRKHSYGLEKQVDGDLLFPLEEAGIPLFLDLEQTTLTEVDAVLKRHPSLKLILIRVGYRIDQWLFPLFRKHPNLHIDLSLYPVHRGIETIVEQFGPERMIFATGLPVWDGGAAISHIQYANISPEDRDRIAYQNLESLLWKETAPETEAEPIAATPPDAIWEKARAGKPLEDLLVIDPHTHMGPYHNFPIPGNPWAEGMLEVMDEQGVDMAVTAPMIALEGGIREGNQIAIDASKKFPGRFGAFCTINPNFPEKEIREELEWCFQQDCFKGIKIHPGTHDTPGSDPSYLPVWEFAQQHELPILIHTWGTDPRCNPAMFEPIARDYPHARLILGHSGATPAGIDEAIEVSKRVSNTYLDLTKSIIYHGMLEYMVEELSADRILWGTDLPFICGSGQLGRVAAARLSLDDKRKILGLNAKHLFRL